jgi:positive regulator of sigma E activity
VYVRFGDLWPLALSALGLLAGWFMAVRFRRRIGA